MILFYKLAHCARRIVSVELRRWSVRNPRTFFTEDTENTEFRGNPCRNPENQDFHSVFLFRSRSCLTRSPYSPYPLYPPFQFAKRNFFIPNSADAILPAAEKSGFFFFGIEKNAF